MKNKVIGVLLLFMVPLLLTGCGGSKHKATIVSIGGLSTELTIDELNEKIKSNTSSFFDDYVTGKITITDKIKNIEDSNGFVANSIGCNHTSYKGKVVKITFENEWISLYVNKELDSVNISSLSVGDTIEVITNISSIYSDKDDIRLFLASYDGLEECEFGSVPTKVTKID